MTAARGNPVKSRLADGKVVVGCLLAYDAPWLVEMIGLAGYDFVAVDLEHEPFDAKAVSELIRAADGAGVVPIVRMPCDERVLPLLSAGAKGVQVPGVRDADHAGQIVEKLRFPPLGRRTYYAKGRATGYGLGLDEEAWRAGANDDLLVIAMIEDVEAIEQLDDILAVDGIDAVQVGPLDLAESLGSRSTEELEAAIDQVVRGCQVAGKPVGVGVVVPKNAETVTSRLAQGAQILTVTSAWLVADAIATNLRAIEDAMPEELRVRASTGVTYPDTDEQRTTGGVAA